MKTGKLLIIWGLMLIALILIVIPASAKATRIEVEAYEVKCYYNPGIEWESDGIYHARDGFQVGPRIPLSDEDPIQEMLEIESTVNLNLNFKTGEGNGWGKFTSENFVGTWNGKLTEWKPGIWVISGKSVGHGVSPEFEGWQLRVEWETIDPAAFPGMCNGANPVSALHAHATYLIPGK
jgi:hypothetical protein